MALLLSVTSVAQTWCLRTAALVNTWIVRSETCKNTRKILKNGEVAPPKEDPVHFLNCHVKTQMHTSCFVMVLLAYLWRQATSLNRVKQEHL